MLDTIDIKELIFEDRPLVEAKVEEYLWQISHKELREAGAHIINAGGKRIRPALITTAYKAAGGKDVESIMPVAVAMELIHNWTLMHDDIIDKSDTRRNVPTVHKQWDETVAILAGDMLNNLAYRLVTQSGLGPEVINKVNDSLATASMAVIDGELMDVEFESRSSVSQQEYFEMIDKKTGALFMSSAKVGALLATDDELVICALESYAKKIGVAFQIQDDLLDMLADEAELGKEVGKDIKEGKKTLMVIHAMNNTTGRDREKLVEILNSPDNTAEEVQQAIQIMQRSGSIDFSMQLLHQLVEEAKAVLSILPDTPYKAALAGLAEYIANRTK